MKLATDCKQLPLLLWLLFVCISSRIILYIPTAVIEKFEARNYVFASASTFSEALGAASFSLCLFCTQMCVSYYAHWQ